MRKRVKIHIKGIVQGVGFRPYIYNLSRKFRLGGFCLNDYQGVVVEVEGEEKRIEGFLRQLERKPPSVSLIDGIEKNDLFPRGEKSFSIKKSVAGRDKFVFISYDLSICNDCLKELFSPQDRRYLYPFINCTNCGPRFTIIKDVPYDRPSTTMMGFKMCSHCLKEYNDFADRRFHAQPNACFKCGPAIKLTEKVKDFKVRKATFKETQDICDKTAQLILKGKITAIKGIGGYHLACDAKNAEVVARLRISKRRLTKPFALMVDKVEVCEKYCFLSKQEKEILLGRKRPITLLKIKKERPWMQEVAPQQRYLGFMFPYAPLHYLLFYYLRKYSKEPILIMTSGNKKDCPLVSDEKKLRQLKSYADYFLLHNRPVYVRCDDSIVRVFRNREIIIRKARGYIPDFFEFYHSSNISSGRIKKSKSILACGGELKNTFSIIKDRYLITSPYIGDLKSYPNYEFFLSMLSHYKKIFSIEPEVIAYDYHPNYLSTQYALSLKDKLKVPVQHHHAHLAACMLEHKLKEKVIGICFDGSGLGEDNKIWGGEFFIVDRKSFLRAGHFRYFGLIGGDKAVEEPARVGFYLLYAILGEELFDWNLPFLNHFNKEEISSLGNLFKKKLFVLTSSSGRLFDAAATLLGLKNKISYEAEAAILLEMYASNYKGKRESFNFSIRREKGVYIVDWHPLFLDMAKEVRKGKDISLLAYKFHRTISLIIKEMAHRMRKDYGLRQVVLSGGVFQNFLLLTESVRMLEKEGFLVYYPARFPSNDGGVSIGQAVVASENIKR
jgi:hydrogenase maturation protein HypF